MVSRNRIVILTGSGISAESGLATFRGKDGIWTKNYAEEFSSPKAYEQNPSKVLEFYNERRRNLADKVPNAAHYAIAKLQREYSGEVMLVTQNVDDLHEQAGSSNVIHMHGELYNARCLACSSKMPWKEDMTIESACSFCGEIGRMRPDVVWFEETPYQLPDIFKALKSAACFVSIGTSGAVYPAAGFVKKARSRGVRTVELNLEPSENFKA